MNMSSYRLALGQWYIKYNTFIGVWTLQCSNKNNVFVRQISFRFYYLFFFIRYLIITLHFQFSQSAHKSQRKHENTTIIIM